MIAMPSWSDLVAFLHGEESSIVADIVVKPRRRARRVGRTK